MRKLKLLVVTILVISTSIIAQEPDSLVEERVDEEDLVKVIEEGEKTTITIGDAELMIITYNKDGITITIGDEDLFHVLENENGVTIKIGEEKIRTMIEEMEQDEEPEEVNEDIEDAIKEIGEILEEVINEINKEIAFEIEEEEYNIKGDKEDILEILENGDVTSIYIGDNEFITVEEGMDTTRIRVGNKGIQIVEDNYGNTSVHLEKIDSKKPKKFKGHYQGLDFGFNDFMNSNYSMSLSGADQFMELNTARSGTFGLNFLQYSFGIVGNQFGIVTGMSFQFTDYFFSGNNNIYIDSLGNVAERFFDDFDLIKTKLSATYLQVPLLLEVQFPNTKRRKRVYLSAGVVGDAKLGSHTKVVYREDGNRQKDKIKGDFNLRQFRYGITTRLGYKALNLFAVYYPNTLFEENKGPEIYPFTIGISLTP